MSLKLFLAAMLIGVLSIFVMAFIGAPRWGAYGVGVVLMNQILWSRK